MRLPSEVRLSPRRLRGRGLDPGCAPASTNAEWRCKLHAEIKGWECGTAGYRRPDTIPTWGCAPTGRSYIRVMPPAPGANQNIYGGA